MIETIVCSHSRELTIQLPPEYVDQDLRITVCALAELPPAQAKRQLGWMKGPLELSPDFDEPLDDFREFSS